MSRNNLQDNQQDNFPNTANINVNLGETSSRDALTQSTSTSALSDPPFDSTSRVVTPLVPTETSPSPNSPAHAECHIVEYSTIDQLESAIFSGLSTRQRGAVQTAAPSSASSASTSSPVHAASRSIEHNGNASKTTTASRIPLNHPQPHAMHTNDEFFSILHTPPFLIQEDYFIKENDDTSLVDPQPLASSTTFTATGDDATTTASHLPPLFRVSSTQFASQQLPTPSFPSSPSHRPEYSHLDTQSGTTLTRSQTTSYNVPISSGLGSNNLNDVPPVATECASSSRPCSLSSSSTNGLPRNPLLSEHPCNQSPPHHSDIASSPPASSPPASSNLPPVPRTTPPTFSGRRPQFRVDHSPSSPHNSTHVESSHVASHISSHRSSLAAPSGGSSGSGLFFSDNASAHSSPSSSVHAPICAETNSQLDTTASQRETILASHDEQSTNQLSTVHPPPLPTSPPSRIIRRPEQPESLLPLDETTTTPISTSPTHHDDPYDVSKSPSHASPTKKIAPRANNYPPNNQQLASDAEAAAIASSPEFMLSSQLPTPRPRSRNSVFFKHNAVSKAKNEGVVTQSTRSTQFLASLSEYRLQQVNGDTFAEYEIIVVFPPLTWSIWRRYSEIEGLYTALLRLPEFTKGSSFDLSINPLAVQAMESRGEPLPLPKLPPKRLFNRLNETFIRDRQALLRVWWDNVMTYSDVLLRCRPFMEFVGLVTPESTQAMQALGGISRNMYIESFYRDCAKEGDILLFHTQGLLQTIQRGYLRSSYDHVGVIVRIPFTSTSPEALHLFESTTEGVHVYPLLRRVLAWNATGASIVYRRLVHDRSLEARQRVYMFLLENDRKTYSLSNVQVWRNKYLTNSYNAAAAAASNSNSQSTISENNSSGFSTLTKSQQKTHLSSSFSQHSNNSTSSSSSPRETARFLLSDDESSIVRDASTIPLAALLSVRDCDADDNDDDATATLCLPPSPLNSSVGLSTIGARCADCIPPIRCIPSYFCSELVAYVWLAMFAVKSSREPASYLPASFSDQCTASIPFMPNVSLEPECLITFKAPEITTANQIPQRGSLLPSQSSVSFIPNKPANSNNNTSNNTTSSSSIAAATKNSAQHTGPNPHSTTSPTPHSTSSTTTAAATAPKTRSLFQYQQNQLKMTRRLLAQKQQQQQQHLQNRNTISRFAANAAAVNTSVRLPSENVSQAKTALDGTTDVSLEIDNNAMIIGSVGFPDDINESNSLPQPVIGAALPQAIPANSALTQFLDTTPVAQSTNEIAPPTIVDSKENREHRTAAVPRQIHPVGSASNPESVVTSPPHSSSSASKLGGDRTDASPKRRGKRVRTNIPASPHRNGALLNTTILFSGLSYRSTPSTAHASSSSSQQNGAENRSITSQGSHVSSSTKQHASTQGTNSSYPFRPGSVAAVALLAYSMSSSAHQSPPNSLQTTNIQSSIPSTTGIPKSASITGRQNGQYQSPPPHCTLEVVSTTVSQMPNDVTTTLLSDNIISSSLQSSSCRSFASQNLQETPENADPGSGNTSNSVEISPTLANSTAAAPNHRNQQQYHHKQQQQLQQQQQQQQLLPDHLARVLSFPLDHPSSSATNVSNAGPTTTTSIPTSHKGSETSPPPSLPHSVVSLTQHKKQPIHTNQQHLSVIGSLPSPPNIDVAHHRNKPGSHHSLPFHPSFVQQETSPDEITPTGPLSIRGFTTSVPVIPSPYHHDDELIHVASAVFPNQHISPPPTSTSSSSSVPPI